MDKTIDMLRVRAKAGDARALTDLGLRLLTADGVQPSPQEGLELVERAARKGDGEATALMSRLAAWGVLQPRKIERALDLLQRAADLDWAPAQKELRFLARSHGADWTALRGAIDVEAWRKSPPLHKLSDQPRLYEIEKFATPAECDWLIESGANQLRRARVYHGKDALETSHSRTNSEASFMFRWSDAIISLIRDRIAAAANVSADFCEVTKLLHYQPGEKFDTHVDFFDPTNPAMSEEMRRRGQRVVTFLVYLNDDYEGGETEFPRTNIRFKGAKGDALLFVNVDASGAPDYSTLHAGLSPTSGEKWLLSQWIRSHPVNAFMTTSKMPPPLGPDWFQAIRG